MRKEILKAIRTIRTGKVIIGEPTSKRKFIVSKGFENVPYSPEYERHVLTFEASAYLDLAKHNNSFEQSLIESAAKANLVDHILRVFYGEMVNDLDAILYELSYTTASRDELAKKLMAVMDKMQGRDVEEKGD